MIDNWGSVQGWMDGGVRIDSQLQCARSCGLLENSALDKFTKTSPDKQVLH